MNPNKKYKKKYKILEECVGCGACKTICPKHCISKGNPFTIQEDKCIGCGLCTTRCWRKCIVVDTSR